MASVNMTETNGLLHQVGDLVKQYREERGLSKKRLTVTADIADGHVYHLEQNERAPSTMVCDKLSRALRLDEFQYNQLMMAAGYLPPAIRKLGEWNITIQVVAKVLSSSRVSDKDKQEFKDAIRRLAQYYLGGKS